MIFYDRDGNMITLSEWVDLNGRDGYVRVGLDQVGDLEVSTIWVGTADCRFETLVFPIDADPDSNDGPLEGESYAILAEAEAGHARWVEQVRAKAGAR